MEPRRIMASDGISRILSLLSILVAVGALFYLMQENQKLKTELTTITEKINGEDGEGISQDWDTKFTSALSEFEGRAQKSLDKFDSARDARNKIVDAYTQSSDVGVSRKEVADMIAEGLSQVENANLAAQEPPLRVAQLSVKPTSDADANLVAITNVGTSSAEIVAALFRPTKDGQRKVPLATAADSSAGHVIIWFSPEDNKATEQGRHSAYKRSYIIPEQIDPESTVKLSVEIHDGTHIGWGLEGELDLEYDDGKKLTVPVRAIFVKSKSETT